jgi:bla regulator protein blaR1
MTALGLGYPAALAAWAVIHSCWIGAAAALAAGWVDRRLAGADPTLRYRVLVGIAIVGLGLPVLPAVAVHRSMFSSAVLAEAASRASGAAAGGPDLGRWLPPLAGVWAAGVALSLLRLGAGLVAVTRLVRRARPSARGRLLAVRLGEPGRLDVREIDRGSSPFVAGLLRPVLVVPRRLLRGLSLDQLATLFRHEIAHLRRRDYAQNLVQRLIECLLWFNPGARLVSRRIREAREACCDRAAVRSPGDGLALARALVHLEEIRTALPAGVAAAHDGNLTRRVRGLIAPPRAPSRRDLTGVLMLLALGLPLTGWAAFGAGGPSGALTRRSMPLTRVSAVDPGGRFVVEMLGGRVLAAGFDGSAPRRDLVSQRGRRASLVAPSGGEVLRLAVRVGGFRWNPRPPPR